MQYVVGLMGKLVQGAVQGFMWCKGMGSGGSDWRRGGILTGYVTSGLY
jgi:hypothetical protein